MATDLLLTADCLLLTTDYRPMIGRCLHPRLKLAALGWSAPGRFGCRGSDVEFDVGFGDSRVDGEASVVLPADTRGAGAGWW